MKNFLVALLRKSLFQPLWEKMHHMSIIFMNYCGGSHVKYSGEKSALIYASKKAGTNSIIFDVGGNEGQYALIANNVFKNAVIHSFEPSLSTFKILKKQVSSHQNIFPHNIGFGAISTTESLFHSNTNSSMASLIKTDDSVNDSYETVTIDTIDNFCQQNSIGKIWYLKIDIEGYEFEALKGAKKMITEKRIHFIQFEFGEFHISARVFFKDFYDLLKTDYRFYRIVPDGLREIKKYSPDLEIFHTMNYLLELKSTSS